MYVYSSYCVMYEHLNSNCAWFNILKIKKKPHYYNLPSSVWNFKNNSLNIFLFNDVYSIKIKYKKKIEKTFLFNFKAKLLSHPRTLKMHFPFQGNLFNVQFPLTEYSQNKLHFPRRPLCLCLHIKWSNAYIY